MPTYWNATEANAVEGLIDVQRHREIELSIHDETAIPAIVAAFGIQSILSE